MRNPLLGILLGIPILSIGQINVGIQAGMNLTSINFKNFNVEKRNLTRLNAGLMMNIPLEENWSIYTGLYYSGKGVKHSRTYTSNKIDSVTIRLNYIQSP